MCVCPGLEGEGLLRLMGSSVDGHLGYQSTRFALLQKRI
jgi:hypothetical protein